MYFIENEKWKFKNKLNKPLAVQFEMKGLGKLKFFLRKEISYSRHGILVSQRKYVFDLIKKTGKVSRVAKPLKHP